MPIASRGRVAVIASLAVAVAFTSGCSWFRKDNDAYKLSGEARPLEIPPELDRPSADAAMALPEGGTSVMASQADKRAPATSAVTGSMRMPSQPRAISPLSISFLTTSLATDAGMANAIPTLPPLGV